MKVDEVRIYRVLVAVLAGVLVAAVVRNGWLADDAYITLRVADNFVSGHGLRWNVADRVQVYTHPLWLFWITAFYWLFPEPYYTLLGVSVLTSAAVVALLIWLHRRRPLRLIPVLCALIASKAFVDYSTSGLENPMSHLLLLAIYATHWRPARRPWLALTALAALAVLNRPDLLLLALPALAIEAWRTSRERGWLRTAAAGVLGFSPLILWHGFSLFYYGSPVANTAYAKLNTGVPKRELIIQGLHYFAATLKQDPATLAAIAAAALAVTLCRRWTLLPAVAGIVLYLIYVLWIGGDFMAGRFLTAPLVLSLSVLATLPLAVRGESQPRARARDSSSGQGAEPQTYWSISRILQRRDGGEDPLSARLGFCHGLLGRRAVMPALGLLLILCYAAGRSPRVVAGEVDGGVKLERFHGVVDERRFYFKSTAWIGVRQGVPLPSGGRARVGREARAQARAAGEPVIKVRRTVGMYGYCAGPEVHVIGRFGLVDALLARLPVADAGKWRIGHFRRELPAGYLRTIRNGSSRIANPDLAVYYRHLSEVIRGDLWSWSRLRTLARLNLGHYDHYLEAYLEKYPDRHRPPRRGAPPDFRSAEPTG